MMRCSPTPFEGVHGRGEDRRAVSASEDESAGTTRARLPSASSPRYQKPPRRRVYLLEIISPFNHRVCQRAMSRRAQTPPTASTRTAAVANT